MQDIVLGLYVTGIAVTVIVYVRVMQKLMRNGGTNSTFFSFPKTSNILKSTRKKRRGVEQQVSCLSGDEQIDQLTLEMLSSNNGAERRKLLDQIRELESQR